MTAQPIEMDGILYAATWGGMVYALNPASGSVFWAADLGTVPTDCGDFPAGGYAIGVIETLASDEGNGQIFTPSLATACPQGGAAPGPGSVITLGAAGEVKKVASGPTRRQLGGSQLGRQAEATLTRYS